MKANFQLATLYGEGNGNPLEYPCLGNPTDGGTWQAIVYGVARVGHDQVTKHTARDVDGRFSPFSQDQPIKIF